MARRWMTPTSSGIFETSRRIRSGLTTMSSASSQKARRPWRCRARTAAPPRSGRSLEKVEDSRPERTGELDRLVGRAGADDRQRSMTRSSFLTNKTAATAVIWKGPLGKRPPTETASACRDRRSLGSVAKGVEPLQRLPASRLYRGIHASPLTDMSRAHIVQRR